MGKSERANVLGRSVSYKSPHSHFSKGGRKEKDRAQEHSKRNQWRSASYSDGVFDAPVKTTKDREQTRLQPNYVGFSVRSRGEEHVAEKQNQRRGRTGRFLGHQTTERSKGRLFMIGLCE
eukprot:TRINITY_DN3466_c0_g1_i1.p1 TRINITY_DN3466_c0_g1~~TRINITY_DN3466_c0_g1_i1.p1  ORF type:complete len:137 (+),score=20.16 TRINITY_DN3466_c0_g1_i1:53-412(+)